MHFGFPEVPELYRMNSGWLNGSCSNARGLFTPVLRKVESVALEGE
jgi:hypothetical protein